MRLIGSLDDKSQVENFSAYLLTEGIPNQIEQEGTSFEIWIKDEDSLVAAGKELEAFKSDPNHLKYSGAIEKAKKIQDDEIRRRHRIRKNFVSVQGSQVKRKHPLTILIIFIASFVALMTDFGSERSITRATFRAMSFNGVSDPAATGILERHQNDRDAAGVRLASIFRGEIWRLVTPIFLHFDVFHLVFNMYWLFIFGSQIENRYRSLRFALLVLAAAIVSNFFQGFMPENIGGSSPVRLGGYLVNLFGGMSGVNYALFGFIVAKMMNDRNSGLFLPQSTIMILSIWLVFCMTPLHAAFFGSSVANWAHVIGLIVGVIAAYFPTVMRA